MGKIYERCFKKEVDKEAVAYYRDVIQTIKAHGMKPIVSLEHWDIPAILLERYDGWASRETVDLYVDYVQKVLDEFHDEVDLWFAFTEPNIPIDNGYIKKYGIHLCMILNVRIRHIFIRSWQQPKR